MDFCERCKAIIIMREGKIVCPGCGYRPKKKIKIEATEKIDKHGGVAVIKENEDNTYPIVQIDCIKCDSKRAYFWTTQTRASDESETKFYKCLKCKHTWRKYR